mmetsp:Transcript_46124/g.149849  ORF Transcript_46124/g.149849 Transcript_46124/m.149849 type:complete len:235 (-) Transcript_46124:1489-2193(-)
MPTYESSMCTSLKWAIRAASDKSRSAACSSLSGASTPVSLAAAPAPAASVASLRASSGSAASVSSMTSCSWRSHSSATTSSSNWSRISEFSSAGAPYRYSCFRSPALAGFADGRTSPGERSSRRSLHPSSLRVPLAWVVSPCGSNHCRWPVRSSSRWRVWPRETNFWRPPVLMRRLRAGPSCTTSCTLWFAPKAGPIRLARRAIAPLKLSSSDGRATKLGCARLMRAFSIATSS